MNDLFPLLMREKPHSLKDIDGNIGIAEYYDDEDPSVKINGNFVINYDATGVNAENFLKI